MKKIKNIFKIIGCSMAIFTVMMSSFAVTILDTKSVFAAVVTTPQTSYTGLVQCDGVVSKTATTTYQKQCDFNALIKQINFLINWAFFMSVPIAVGFLAYAGYYYMFTGEAGHTKAKAIFQTIGLGFLGAASGWFVIHTILSYLTKPDMGFGSLLGG